MTDRESALVKPIRNVFKVVGAVLDAIYYFFDSLINPNRARYFGGRLVDSGRSNGPRIATLRPPGSGNAPNMSIGGCRSCQM